MACSGGQEGVPWKSTCTCEGRGLEVRGRGMQWRTGGGSHGGTPGGMLGQKQGAGYMSMHLAWTWNISCAQELTCLISKVLKDNTSSLTVAGGLLSPSTGEPPSSSVGSGFERNCGSHCLTLVTMASTACPAAIRVSQDLLIRYVLTWGGGGGGGVQKKETRDTILLYAQMPILLEVHVNVQ